MNIKELFPTIIENTKQFWEDLKVPPNGKNLLKKYPETLKHFPNELPQEAMYGLIGVVVGLLLILLGLGSLAPGLLLKIIKHLKVHNFNRIILTVNYKADLIQDYFKDGNHLGLKIEYIHEAKKMGTAGSLSLIETGKYTPDSFLVMNCDIVTDIDFTALFEFHESQKSLATMCINQFDFKMTYGVVETCETKITQIKEKPVYKFNVNSGIYVLSKHVFKNIPKNEFYDMPQLFDRLLLDSKEVHAFLMHEKWIDIGQFSDLERANNIEK